MTDISKRRKGQLSKAEKSLIGFCDKRREAAENHYKDKYQSDWRKFRLLWESKFDETLRSRKSERSKVITPTLQTAVDTASADIDAVVGYFDFFEIDPKLPRGMDNAQWVERFQPLWSEMLDTFKEDIRVTGSRREISEAIFHSALYGIGYIKTVSEEVEDRTIAPGEKGIGAVVSVETRGVTKQVSVDPNLLWPDPGATCDDDAEYLVELSRVASSVVDERIISGLYRDVVLPDLELSKGSLRELYEYHGLVPKGMLRELDMPEDEMLKSLEEVPVEIDDSLVEAIIIWPKDGSGILYAEENPFFDGGRSYTSFPWDMNPGHIVGKGISSKIFNIQKTQDAGLRARIDALAFSVHPVIGIDSMKLINRRRMVIEPGAQLVTQGRPSDAIEQFKFGDLPQSAFVQAQELAQMADNATGIQAFGGVDPKYQAATGLDILSQGSVNRNRRTLERLNTFLERIVSQFLWRSTQYDSERYPPVAEGFTVHVILGSLTRRTEMAQISSMLQTLPENSPAYWRLLVKFFELSDIPDKELIIQDLIALSQQSINPPEPQNTLEQEVLLRQITMAEKESEDRTELQRQRVRAELVRAAASLEKIDSEEVRNTATAVLNIAKAEATERGVQLDEYLAVVKELQENARGTGAPTGD